MKNKGYNYSLIILSEVSSLQGKSSHYSRILSPSFIFTLTAVTNNTFALQYINNLETKRSYKRKVNLKTLNFLKKSIEWFKNYWLIC